MELVHSRQAATLAANGSSIVNPATAKVTAEQTLNKLANLQPISEAELSGLQVFFRNFDDVKRAQPLPQNAMPSALPMMAGAAKPAV